MPTNSNNQRVLNCLVLRHAIYRTQMTVSAMCHSYGKPTLIPRTSCAFISIAAFSFFCSLLIYDLKQNVDKILAVTFSNRQKQEKRRRNSALSECEV